MMKIFETAYSNIKPSMNFIMNKTKCLDEESNNRVAKMDNPA